MKKPLRPLKKPFLLLSPVQTGLRHTLGLHQDPTQVAVLPELSGIPGITLIFGNNPALSFNPLRVTLWNGRKCLAIMNIQKRLRAMEGKDRVSRNDRQDLTRFVILNQKALWDCWSLGNLDPKKLRSAIKKLNSKRKDGMLS